jgi:hypothetical protein
MSLLLVLLLDSWPVAAGQALVEGLHTYDLEALDVDATPGAEGLVVDCRITVRGIRPGPVRFFFSPAAGTPEVTRDGAQVPCATGLGGLEALLDVLGVDAQAVPHVLTLEAELAAGERATFRLRYTWRPEGDGWYRALKDDVQTHLSGFWLPAMADELFTARVAVRTDAQAFAPGRASRTESGWLFETVEPAQIVPLVVGAFERVEAEGCEVFAPPGFDGADGIARDLAAVLRTLEGWLGPAGERPFRLVLAPHGAGPSYCGGSFAVLHGGAPGRARAAWLAHLAHECAHVWFGHRLKTRVIGDGGTWLREGLAEWAGIEVMGALLSAEARDELWRGRFARYVSRIDLRRAADGVLFANEPTLWDSTYVDDAAVPYLRGALVLRLLARQAGEEEFRARLRRLLARERERIVPGEEIAAALGDDKTWRYYARTTRLPDLRLEDFAAGAGSARARIRCDDPAWAGGRVPVRIETAAGAEVVEVLVRGGEGTLDWRGELRPVRVEVDPERLFLDPIRSNSTR